MKTFYLLDGENTVITGGERGTSDAAADTQAGTVAAPSTVGGSMQSAFGGTSLVSMLLIYAAVFGALWFFMIRPQRKREKEAKELRDSIRSGDNVVTSGGLFGKVTDVGEDCFVIEFGTNRGIRIPVRKSDVLGIKTPNINPSTKEISAEK